MAIYSKLMVAAALGGLALVSTACGDKCEDDPYAEECPATTDGVCDWIANEVINPDDPECVMDDDCDEAFEGDPDCIRDGQCNTDDPRDNGEDPDCTFCDYNPEDYDCVEWFTPSQVDVDGMYGFDPATGNAVDFIRTDDSVGAASITVVIYTEKFATSQDPNEVCAMDLVPSSGTPAKVDWHSFSAALTGPAADYDHYGMTLKAGEFDVIDNTLGGQIRGCLEVEADTADLTDGKGGFRPDVYGDDFSALITTQDWGVFVGEPSSEIDGYLSDSANNDPNNDYDAVDLYPEFTWGGSQLATNVDTQVFFYGSGIALDESFKMVDSGNEDDPIIHVPVSNMAPVGETPAARAAYFVRSALYIWQAPAILGAGG